METIRTPGTAKCSAIIAGGGIAGITAALCLQRIGWQVRVLEQAVALDELGAGIQLSPNACSILFQLGLEDALRDRAFAPERIDMRLGRSGKAVFSIPLAGTAVARWGAPYLHLHRADLIAVLAGALKQRAPGSVSLGCTVSGFEQAGERVAVTCANGRRFEANMLIGADGIHSTVRQQMLGQAPARYTGHTAWRAVVPMDQLDALPPPSACVWVGRKRHAVTYRLRGGSLANLVGVVEQAEPPDESWSATGTTAQARMDFDGWHPTVTGMIEAAPTLHRWALHDRPPLKQWSSGRVTLIGDACHPMLPFLAQGAAMGIEDAATLAQLLSAAPPGVAVETTLQALYARRIARTSRVQAEARANGRRFHLPMDWMYAPIGWAAKLSPARFHGRYDWLYADAERASRLKQYAE